MRAMSIGSLLLQLAAAGVTHAQATNDLHIWVKGYTVTNNGGEQPSVGTRIDVGKAGNAGFSFNDCGMFLVSQGPFIERATAGWRVIITPLRVVDDAVTFRLRWTRVVDNGKTVASPAGENIELTLRPGESRPLDSVRVSRDAKTFGNPPCRVSAASIRVSLEYLPDEFDRRLVLADLWLVERLPNGTERSQPLSIRGLPSRPFPFYFESIVDGKMSLDIFGHLIARPESGTIDISLETRSRLADGDTFKSPQRAVESTLRVKPAEIVEVRLPKLGESAGPFANRDLSIRIRARQLR